MKNAIAILSASIKKDRNGKWVSTQLKKEDDKLGAPGGDMRVMAAAYLLLNKKANLIITTGGRGWDIVDDEPGRPDLSRILKDELIELGVPAERIIEENKSNKTFEQLKEIKNIIDLEKIDCATIVTNDYHLPRVRAMIEADQGLSQAQSDGKIKQESAEEICLRYDQKRWQNIIKAAYGSEEIKARIKKEQQGIKDIKTGRYKY